MRNSKDLGKVYAIPLSDKGFTFCVRCVGQEFTFFDYLSNSATIPDLLLSLPVAFHIFVGKGEPKHGKWLELGKVELDGEFLQPGKFLHKPVGSDEYFIYQGGKSNPASLSEVKDLELFSVWFSEHVRKRLEEYYDGKKSSAVFAIKKHLGVPV